tara:strand:- start:1112 stop:2176 length:1065 start_codon:yes stop_codon:yes gene_type:complete
MNIILLVALLIVSFLRPTFAQIGDDGTGVVNGYKIGPNAVLTGADLRRTDLKGANLTRAILNGAVLEGADLSDSILLGTEFQNSNLKNTKLMNSNFGRANLSGADLSNSNLTNVTMDQSLLVNANLQNTNLTSAFLFNCNLSGTDFTGANFYKILSGYIVGRPSVLPEGWILSIDGSYFVGFGANLRAAELTNTRYLGSVLTALTEKAFEKIISLESSTNGIPESVTANTTKINELNSQVRDNTEESAKNSLTIDTLKAQISEISTKLETLVASVAEKDAQIAELKKRPTLDQVRDARAGSIVLTVEPDGNNITLGMTIEQSDNLVEWTSLDGEMTRTIPIPDGKKFYRFAFDK